MASNARSATMSLQYRACGHTRLVLITILARRLLLWIGSHKASRATSKQNTRARLDVRYYPTANLKNCEFQLTATKDEVYCGDGVVPPELPPPPPPLTFPPPPLPPPPPPVTPPPPVPTGVPLLP